MTPGAGLATLFAPFITFIRAAVIPSRLQAFMDVSFWQS
jgi:hypothetical protein